MKKSEIRKKILEIRKQKNSNNLIINFEKILKILKKIKFSKTIGGYYPYNYEVDSIKILEKFEKKKLSYFFAKNKKKFSNGFFPLVNKRSISNK